MHLKANLIGSISVVLWGVATAVSLLVSREIGAHSYFILMFTSCGLLGFYFSKKKSEPKIEKAVFYNKYFYLRGFLFILHESLSIFSIYYVSKENVPVVILINYLWPSAIIICSVMFAGVKISNWKWFLTGTLLVISSLSYEIIGSKYASIDIFAKSGDVLAYILTFIGAIAWGLYCAFTRKSQEDSGGGRAVKYYQLAFVAFTPLLYIFPPLQTEYWSLTILLLLICIAINFVSYICWDYGMRKGDIVILSLAADFIPWISLFSVSLLHSISINSHTIVSAALLIIGAIVTRSGTLYKKTVYEESA